MATFAIARPAHRVADVQIIRRQRSTIRGRDTDSFPVIGFLNNLPEIPKAFAKAATVAIAAIAGAAVAFLLWYFRGYIFVNGH